MSTTSFIQAKKIGRKFEAQVRDVLRDTGFEVVDSDKQSYLNKRGWDCLVRVKGQEARIEIKYDALSELTQNVALEPRAIGHSISPIWVYGLPQTQEIALYAMFLSDLKKYAYEYYKAHPGAIKRAGEWGDWVILVPKWEFVSQPFVRKLKTINLN